MQKRLTPRETQIFNMLLNGSVPKEIAGLLSISYETVLYHQKKLYRKLEVHSINELFNKYSPDSSDSAHPAGAAQGTLPRKEIKAGTLKKGLFLKIAVFAAVVLCFEFSLPYIYNLREKISVPNPVVIAFTDDGPQREGEARGWQFIIDRGLFFYHGEWRKSPYRFNKNERITAGDSYDVSCTFTSDVDIGYLEAGFFDSLTGGKDGYYWTLLSGRPKILSDIKAGVEYNVSLNLSITKTASCDADIANRFILIAGPKTENIPTLTFTKFEITKH